MPVGTGSPAEMFTVLETITLNGVRKLDMNISRLALPAESCCISLVPVWPGPTEVMVPIGSAEGSDESVTSMGAMYTCSGGTATFIVLVSTMNSTLSTLTEMAVWSSIVWYSGASTARLKLLNSDTGTWAWQLLASQVAVQLAAQIVVAAASHSAPLEHGMAGNVDPPTVICQVAVSTVKSL